MRKIYRSAITGRFVSKEFAEAPVTKRWVKSGFIGDMTQASIQDHHTLICETHWHTLSMEMGTAEWKVETCMDHGYISGELAFMQTWPSPTSTCTGCGGPVDRRVVAEGSPTFHNTRIVDEVFIPASENPGLLADDGDFDD